MNSDYTIGNIFGTSDLKSKAESLFCIKFPITKEEFLKVRKDLLFKYHGDKAGVSDTAKFTEVIKVSKLVIENLVNLNTNKKVFDNFSFNQQKTNYKPSPKGWWENKYNEDFDDFRYSYARGGRVKPDIRWWKDIRTESKRKSSRNNKCEICGGDGEINYDKCKNCNGTGNNSTGKGETFTIDKCASCKGTGYTIISFYQMCPECLGNGDCHDNKNY